MKKILPFILCLIITNAAVSQTTEDEEAVTRASLNYIEGFYEGDSLKLKESLKPSLYKYGYWKNRDTGEYGDEIFMTFEEALAYAQRVRQNKNFPPENAPKKVEVLDIMTKIAAVKITAWWGSDYLLLSKHGEKWMIGEVLWEGPNEQSAGG